MPPPNPYYIENFSMSLTHGVFEMRIPNRKYLTAEDVSDIVAFANLALASIARWPKPEPLTEIATLA